MTLSRTFSALTRQELSPTSLWLQRSLLLHRTVARSGTESDTGHMVEEEVQAMDTKPGEHN